MISVAAGMTHSTALTSDGALFYWVSSDPDLRCQQVLVHLTLYFVYFDVFKECSININIQLPFYS